MPLVVRSSGASLSMHHSGAIPRLRTATPLSSGVHSIMLPGFVGGRCELTATKHTRALTTLRYGCGFDQYKSEIAIEQHVMYTSHLRRPFPMNTCTHIF